MYYHLLNQNVISFGFIIFEARLIIEPNQIQMKKQFNSLLIYVNIENW